MDLSPNIVGTLMAKIGRNSPCPCGSGKKYKKCCQHKKPREQVVMVGSPEPLRGFHFDKDKMELMGLTLDGRIIETDVTFSQTHYIGQSGKEKVISRIQDKVIPNKGDLMRHLSSSFNFIIAVDTNTKVIDSEAVSASGILHCVVQRTPDPAKYNVIFTLQGTLLFRNCPTELPSEKFGWMMILQNINRDPLNKKKRYALITDHDLGSHISFNNKKTPIFKDFYLHDNFTIMYGRGDGPNENLLNYLILQCDKQSANALKAIEQNGFCQDGERKIYINQIPVPSLERYRD